MTFVGQLKAELGDSVVLTADEFDMSARLKDLLIQAADTVRPLGIAFPRNTQEVSTILQRAAAARIDVVPQGGLTGLAGGAIPVGDALLLSLERMNRIEEPDPDAMTITAEAGAILQKVQEAADEVGFMFPLDFAGRGSAQVGGFISTNAGGNRVMRFGMTRDLVLGVEVVLADGTVLSMMNKMLKNNSGFDLKHVFIGAEGTLGVITKAVLKLAPKVVPALTALCALPDLQSALALLRRARTDLGQELTSFEVMWPSYFAMGTKEAGRPSPFDREAGIYVLLETMNGRGDPALGQGFLEASLADELIEDAIVATSLREAADLWAIRDCTEVLVRVYGQMAAFDASIPTSQISAFLDAFDARLRERWPTIEYVIFGHIADANLHIGVRIDEKSGTEAEVEQVVYPLIGEWQGGVSGEHGIGTHKLLYLHHARSEDQIEVMRAIKSVLDPHHILNPGKVFSRTRACSAAA